MLAKLPVQTEKAQLFLGEFIGPRSTFLQQEALFTFSEIVQVTVPSH